ncbi:hypothetical protein HY633_05080 [Candidatus Uhrbacteria bacterium]|nr:hypothetical protein [Candidatus Uhrbacteria bacterium]
MSQEQMEREANGVADDTLGDGSSTPRGTFKDVVLYRPRFPRQSRDNYKALIIPRTRRPRFGLSPEDRENIPWAGMRRRVGRLARKEKPRRSREPRMTSWKAAVRTALKQWQRHKRPRHFQQMPPVSLHQKPSPGTPPWST